MKHKARPSGSSGGSRLRLAILAATVAAFMLVPAAQAFANGEAFINIEGTGSGEVTSGTATIFKGTPPIACSYASPGPATGQCETELTVFSTLEGVELKAVPALGSAIKSWEVTGATTKAFCKASELKCNALGPKESNPEIEVTATFVKAFTLTVTKTGTAGPGNGKIKSEPAGIECGATCSKEFAEGSEVVLEGNFFEEEASLAKWSGCDSVDGENKCHVTMSAAKNVEAEINLPVTGPELTVAKEGTGTGTVVSSPAGIECGATCSSTAFAAETEVTLTASPAAGSTFKSWKKCDTGKINGRQCTVKMSVAKTVGAKFEPTKDVKVNVAGSGSVKSKPGGISCLPGCSSTTAAFAEGSTVELIATPSKNWTFTGWSVDCTGTGECKPVMSANREVTATFTEVAKQTLTLTKSGGGTALIKTKPTGVNCGYTCSAAAAAFYEGAVVEVAWKLNKGTTSIEWTTAAGTCTGKVVAAEGTCTVTMSAAKSLNAKLE